MMAFGIWTAACAVFVVFGIAALRAKEPVKFWNLRQVIRVRDVKKYNRAVAKMWFLSVPVLEAFGLPLLAGQNSAWSVISILGGMFWAIAVMAVYVRIEKKYRIL